MVSPLAIACSSAPGGTTIGWAGATGDGDLSMTGEPGFADALTTEANVGCPLAAGTDAGAIGTEGAWLAEAWADWGTDPPK